MENQTLTDALKSAGFTHEKPTKDDCIKYGVIFPMGMRLIKDTEGNWIGLMTWKMRGHSFDQIQNCLRFPKAILELSEDSCVDDGYLALDLLKEAVSSATACTDLPAPPQACA